jgi:hypothetical protein
LNAACIRRMSGVASYLTSTVPKLFPAVTGTQLDPLISDQVTRMREEGAE